MFITITAGPVCSPNAQAIIKAGIKQPTEITAEAIRVPLKLLVIRIADRGGKITNPEISIAPISRIPTTMVKAVSRAKISS